MNTIRKCMLTVALLLGATGANASLIDNGTYTSDTASGLDWLDLSATKGQSVTTALSSHPGWSYANEVQVSGLLSSFGISYVFVPHTAVPLHPTPAQASSFISLLGTTSIGAAMGGYYNGVVGHSTYLCISTGICTYGSFTRDYNFSSGKLDMGQFLVRNSVVAAVPEPETYAMLMAGLGLMAAVARRRKSLQS